MHSCGPSCQPKGAIAPQPESRGLLCCNSPFCVEIAFSRGFMRGHFLGEHALHSPRRAAGRPRLQTPPNLLCKGPCPMQGLGALLDHSSELQAVSDTYLGCRGKVLLPLNPSAPPQSSSGLAAFPPRSWDGEGVVEPRKVRSEVLFSKSRQMGTAR